MKYKKFISYYNNFDDFEIERAMEQAERITDGACPDEKMTAKILL